MSKFPEVSEVGFANPLGMELETKTLTSNYDDLGGEQRKQKWLYPRRNLTLVYNYISKADSETLWQFYIARGGAFEAFNFFMPEPETDYPAYVGEYVGTGDGSTALFNLPSRLAAAYVLYLDGASQTEGVDYNFNPEGGEDGADTIDFSDSAMTAPASGVRITWDFTGTLKIRSRFAEDRLSFEQFYDRLANHGIQLKGLLNQ
jgi:hypothetical protein